MNKGRNVKEVTTLAKSATDEAGMIFVRDRESYVRAAELILTLKLLRNKIVDTFKPIKKRIDDAKREVLNQEREADAPLLYAITKLSPQIIAYERQQELIRKGDEIRLQIEARKNDEDRTLQDAIRAEEAGDKDLSLAILDAPVSATSVFVPKTLPKVPGMSIRKTWSFLVVSPNMIPREYMTPDLARIGAVVRALKGQCNIPGIRVRAEESITGRRPDQSPQRSLPLFGSLTVIPKTEKR